MISFHFASKQVKTINGMTGSAFCLLLMAQFYLTGVLPAPWEETQLYCDTAGNCIDQTTAAGIATFFFAWTVLSLVLSALDSLQPETILEKVEAGAHIFSGLVPRVLGLLLVVLFLREWSLLVILALLITNSSFLSRCKSFSKEIISDVSSCFCSFFLPVLVKADISKKERGQEDVMDPEERTKHQRTLGWFSLANTAVVLLTTTIFVLVTYFSPLVMTDINNVISRTQLLEIFGYIQVPGCIISVVCSVLIILIPQVNLKSEWQIYCKLAINILIILTSISLPLLSGLNLVSPGPQDAFLFLKV